MATTLPTRPSKVGDFAGGIITSPAVQSIVGQIVAAALAALFALIERKVTKPPTGPIDTPTPAPGGDVDGIPDDLIPEPKLEREVKRVRLKILKAQYSRARFPEQYTNENPFGLYPQSYLRQVEAGAEALNYGSKVWTDLTAYDAEDKEFLPPAVLKFGLAFRTEHQLDGAIIAGAGIEPSGEPKPYQAVDSNEVGNGITAWRSTNGFVHQFKVHGEGSFECQGFVAGVPSNHFTVRVS